MILDDDTLDDRHRRECSDVELLEVLEVLDDVDGDPFDEDWPGRPTGRWPARPRHVATC